MSKGLQWVLGLCAVLLTAALAFSFIAPLVFPQAAGGGFWPTMMGGQGHMMDGWGRGWHGFGGFGFMGLGMLAGPLLILGLVVLVAVALLRRGQPAQPAMTSPAAPQAAAQAAPQPRCSNCSYGLQPGWKVCPNCGTPVAG